MLASQNEWGQIVNEKDRKPFLKETTRFVDELHKKIDNLRGDITLGTPSSPFNKIEQKPSAYAQAAQDKEVLAHFRDIMHSWIDQISGYVRDDPSTVPLDKNNTSGPDGEIEYWSRRMLTLISITEQLRSKPNRVVTGVLRARVQLEESEVTSCLL